jgi:AcrR family transcriptional regulator
MNEPAHGDGPRPRGDTRGRIRQVALELFAEQGYEQTSLREVAERLGVTKAALYYHFKSKEDIVAAFAEDYYAEIDALIEWARTQPRTAQARREILDRYIGIVMGSSEVFRFLERNQAAVKGLEGGKRRFEQFRPRLEALVGVLVGEQAPMRGRVRATAALTAASMSCMLFLKDADDPVQLRAIVLELAGDLVAADDDPVSSLSAHRVAAAARTRGSTR